MICCGGDVNVWQKWAMSGENKCPLERLKWLGSSSSRATSLSLFTFMPWRRQWQPTPVLLPGESQGQRSLVSCCLWGRKESNTTEVTWRQEQQILLKGLNLHLKDILPYTSRVVQECIQIKICVYIYIYIYTHPHPATSGRAGRKEIIIKLD